MTPLPPPLGGSELVAWRLDQAIHASTWDSGEGSYMAGGRWNSKGVRAVYCSIDPATAILEIAVQTRKFQTLNTVAYVLTSLTIADPSSVYVVNSVPNANWLRPCALSAGQQTFGDSLLNCYKFVVIPSTVSTHSWNLLFVATAAAWAYAMRSQDPFALDTRLDPPAP